MRETIARVLYCAVMIPLFSCGNAQADSANEGVFEYREIYLPERDTDEAKDLGLNNIDTDWALWGHNLASILPEKPSQTIYAKVSGTLLEDQFCFMSDHLYEYIEEHISDKYGDNDTQHFAILPNDNKIVCTCSKCKAEGNTEKDASPAVFNLINKLAKRFPKHMFFTSYYNTTRNLPKAKLPANVGVLISAMDYPLSAVETPQEEKFKELLSSWDKMTDKIYVWDYINNFDDYFTPFPVFEVMQRRFSLYAKYDVKGVFLNGSGTDYSSMSRLKTHVLSALMKTPDTDWEVLLKSLCDEFYPVTGKTIAEFMIAQEKFVKETGKPLPLYEGVATARKTYLPEAEFVAFYDKMMALKDKTKGDEKEEIDLLCGALGLTRLELYRINATEPQQMEAKLDLLTQMRKSDVEVYSESCWTISGFVKDTRFMAEHAESMRGKNLLKGVKLTPLTHLDEEYSDISILTDGLLGLPSNYHCGNMISSANPSLTISVPKVDGMTHLRVCMAQNLVYHIAFPVMVTLSAGGTVIGHVEPHKTAEHSGHAFAEFEIPANAHGPLTLNIVRDQEVRTMAIDEIEAY